jgi:hypothetical protein
MTFQIIQLEFKNIGTSKENIIIRKEGKTIGYAIAFKVETLT